MCEWGNTKTLEIRGTVRDIDECLYDLVKAFNEIGLDTVACCCGHGKQPPMIILMDGREIFIANDRDIGRQINNAFPPIN